MDCLLLAHNQEVFMFVRFCFSGIISSFILFSSITASGMDKRAVDELIAKVEKAKDPEGVRFKIKTQVSHVEINIPAQKIKLNATITDKFPDKTKTFSEIPGVMSSTRAYNGKSAWEYSPAVGMRDIKGKELDAMKLEMALKNPVMPMRDAFEIIEVPDKLEKVGEFECYKFICTPKKEYNAKPVIFYFDTKSLLLRKMEMVVDSQMGPIKMESTLGDYKKVGKMWTPLLSTIKQMGMILQVKVIDTKNNVNIDDSEFEKPKNPSQPAKGEKSEVESK